MAINVPPGPMCPHMIAQGYIRHSTSAATLAGRAPICAPPISPSCSVATACEASLMPVQYVQFMEAKMQKIGSEAARRQLPELLDRAHSGEPAIIMKRGKPYAALVSLDQCQLASPKAGLLALRGSGSGLWGQAPAETVGSLRGEWD
ncbi:type II toxin-antitoxin system Phd/YefM family antitoxin [Thiohalorhabdus sp.]|uniref:type II toxin-antitoxin system Phd/YefM family antitoxin n=1 Tax=Thiohalorhabdus sp. TaxID=3094134 RepID=UPI003FCEB806